MFKFDPEFIPLMKFILPKVLIATLCGLIIGYDREVKQKVAGIRTNILICVGCTILTSISFYLAKTNPLIDPTRIIGQIITGVGFLGAGVIMKHDDKIVGVTTAAFIWIASAIGILVASVNSILLPITLTLGLLLTSRFFEKIENYIKPKK
jgi:putative Mg2+ transporter-C (MgtC) family protein